MAIPFLLALPAPHCHILQADSILARDVAAVIPDFSRVPNDFRIGYVSASGLPRILRGPDLEHLAKNQGVQLSDLPDVCFVLRTFVPQAAEIEAAMRRTLAYVPGIADATIEISSSSQHPVPFGELGFPRSGLQMPTGTVPEALWRGFARHGVEQFPVWARARITEHTTRVVASINLPAGKPIQKSQVRLESCERFLLDETTARSLDEVVGYVPKNLLQADVPIRKSQIAAPPDIAKGDIVDVEVFFGSAHLAAKGRAEADGNKGSTILVRNLSSGKDFRARVVSRNKVVAGESVQ